MGFSSSMFTPNMSLRGSLEFVLLIFFMGYVGFIPTGPYPVILWGVKLDHLFAFGTALVSFFLFPLRWPKGLILVHISVLLFLCIIFITTITSVDPDTSLRGCMVCLGYATIALFAPLLIHERVILLRRYLFIAATFTGLFVLYLYFFVHDIGRLRLSPTVDPNMTSVGLLMCIIIFLPEYFKKRKTFLIGELATFFFIFPVAIVLAAVIILLSRTALLSFAIALIWAFFCATLKNKRLFYRQILRKISIIIIASILGIVSLNIVKPDIVSKHTHRVTRIFRGNLAPTESRRIMRAENTLDRWTENPKTFVLGDGFFTINPHNEFLRMLGGSGLLGFVSFLLMLVAFYLTCCRSRTASSIYLFGQNALFAYLVIMIQFYGHTKSLWVGFTFLLINYMAQNRPQPRFQITQARQMVIAEPRAIIT